jgi:tyrosyl-tRNA synthetase
LPLAELLVSTGTAASKGEARRAIEGGGVYLNNRRVADLTARATAADTVDGRFLVLRHGRKNYRLVRIIE